MIGNYISLKELRNQQNEIMLKPVAKHKFVAGQNEYPTLQDVQTPQLVGDTLAQPVVAGKFRLKGT